MLKPWRGIRFIGLAVGVVAVVVVLIMVAIVVVIAAIDLWPRAPLSPAESQVQNWLKKGYTGRVGGKDWRELDNFGADTIPFLIAAATNHDSPAPRFVRSLYPKMPTYLQSLPFARDSDSERFAAEQALYNFPSKDHSAVLAALVPVLQDSRTMVRTRAAEVLSARMRTTDTNCLMDLTATLVRETNEYVRLRLAVAIGRIRPDAQEVMLIVSPALTNSDSLMRAVAGEYFKDLENQRNEQNEASR